MSPFSLLAPSREPPEFPLRGRALSRAVFALLFAVGLVAVWGLFLALWRWAGL